MSKTLSFPIRYIKNLEECDNNKVIINDILMLGVKNNLSYIGNINSCIFKSKINITFGLTTQKYIENFDEIDSLYPESVISFITVSNNLPYDIFLVFQISLKYENFPIVYHINLHVNKNDCNENLLDLLPISNKLLELNELKIKIDLISLRIKIPKNLKSHLKMSKTKMKKIDKSRLVSLNSKLYKILLYQQQNNNMDLLTNAQPYYLHQILKNIDIDNQKECQVCFDNMVTNVCYPCGHMLLCNDCYDNMTYDNCPFCMKEIIEFIKVHT